MHKSQSEGSNQAQLPDAEALYRDLREHITQHSAGGAPVHLVGIASGGAWLAERLAADIQVPFGIISSFMHRDDFAKRGLGSGCQTHLLFDVQGADIWLLDDVLYTGRTVRAVLNELFDYGRPARVRLGVLLDRGGRELPIAADFAACSYPLDVQQKLALQKKEQESAVGAGPGITFAWHLARRDAQPDSDPRADKPSQ